MPLRSNQILAGFLVFLAAIALSAQAENQEEATFRADARLVVLHATVVNKSGHLMTDLTQKAFHVYENGVAG
jgi:hypothetical protein